MSGQGHKTPVKMRGLLMIYDGICYLSLSLLIIGFYPSYVGKLAPLDVAINMLLGALCIFVPRLLLGIYNYIWRYAGAEEFIGLIFADAIGLVLFLAAGRIIPEAMTFIHTVALIAFNLLLNIMARMLYLCIYKQRGNDSFLELWALKLLRLFRT